MLILPILRASAGPIPTNYYPRVTIARCGKQLLIEQQKYFPTLNNFCRDTVLAAGV